VLQTNSLLLLLLSRTAARLVLGFSEVWWMCGVEAIAPCKKELRDIEQSMLQVSVNLLLAVLQRMDVTS
jgi:hypothetical protein